MGMGGCAYRLPPVMLPSEYRVKVVATAPERYALRLRLTEARQYSVPADARVALAVPAYRAACSVYLFDKLRIRRGADLLRENRVDLIAGGNVVRQLSLKEIAALPVDADRYHLLTIAERHAGFR